VIRPTGPGLLLALALPMAACTEAPDLAPIAASLGPGTAGLGADRVPDAVARAPFGRQIAAAVTDEPVLRGSAAEIRAARADKRAADGAFRPDISIGASARREVFDSGTESSASPFVRVSQLVYDAGAARADQRGAEARVFESTARQIETGSRVTLEAVEAYKGLSTARRLLTVAQENQRVLQDLADQIEERVRSGAGSTADSLTARSRLADAETQRVDARARLDRAEATFRRLFGEVPDRLAREVAAPPLPSDTADVLDQSPRLRAATAAVKAAEADLAAARARRWPGVEVGATGRESLSGGGTDVAFDLTLDYSLDSRGNLRAAIDAAEARRDAAAADRDALRRDVREALAFVRTDQAAGTARVAAARDAVDSNEASVAAAREQFRIGRRGIVDLLDAQRDLVRAQETLIAAERERFLTDYAALALTGDILDAFDITLPEVAE